MEISPAVPTHLKSLYNKKFYENKTVTHPEITNGIQKVEIYSDEPMGEIINVTAVNEVVLPSQVDPTSQEKPKVRIGLDIS